MWKLCKTSERSSVCLNEPFAFVEWQDGTKQHLRLFINNEGIKYAYGFSFDKAQIINEYLYHWPNGREALVFSREKK